MRRRTQRTFALLSAAVAVGVIAPAVAAHDLFLRPRDFLVRAGATVDVRVLNGTFTSSESVVAADRLRDLTVLGPDSSRHPDHSTWKSAGKESAWRVAVGAPGTYVIGASLTPKTIHLTGDQFTGYLTEEGLPQVLEARRSAGTSGEAAPERYAKHVKALIRVGDPSSGTWAGADTAFRRVLGYPAEIIPLDNPYKKAPSAGLRVRALVDGQPASSQIMLYGGRTAAGKQIAERQVRTDADGIAQLGTSQRGTWYAKFIRMRAVAAAAGDSVNYESKWATLTFAIP